MLQWFGVWGFDAEGLTFSGSLGGLRVTVKLRVVNGSGPDFVQALRVCRGRNYSHSIPL